MAGSPGDGKKGFFEGRFFDIFRGAEGKALAAQDRAEEANRKAEAKAVLAGMDEPDETDNAPAPVAVAANGQGRANLAQSAHYRRLVKAVKQGKKALEAMHDVNEKQSKAIHQLDDRVEKLTAGAVRMAQYLIEKERKDRKTMGFASDAVLAALTGYIGVINAADPVHNTSALGLSAALEAIVLSEYVEGEPIEGWIRVAALAAKGFAYYDAATGIMSVIQSGDTLPPSEEEVVGAAVLDWAASVGLI